MAEEGAVSIHVLDMSGRVLQSIMSNRTLAGGIHMVPIPIEGLENGIYMVQLITPKSQTTKQMKVIKN